MEIKKMLSFMQTSGSLELESIIMYLGMTILLTMVVFMVYKLTYTGVAYSRNFNVSIVLTGVITSTIIMVIGNNLVLSLGMVGALSIVRFRAAIKEPKDISFLFWSIAIGLSAGTGATKIALVSTLIIALLILFFNFTNKRSYMSYLLIVKGESFECSDVEAVLKQSMKKFRLRMKNTKKMSFEAIYEIHIKNKSEDEIIKKLYKLDKIDQVNVVSFNGHLNE